MPTLEIASLVLLGALGWFWLDSLKARDAAIVAARKACESEGLQFLDETVAIGGLKPLLQIIRLLAISHCPLR